MYLQIYEEFAHEPEDTDKEIGSREIGEANARDFDILDWLRFERRWKKIL